MNNSFSRLFVLDVVAATLVFGLIAGIILDRKVVNTFVPPANVEEEAQPSFELMAEAWNTIGRFYIDRESVTDQKLAYGAISGMVDSLGDRGHSRFVSPDMMKQVANVVRGQFVGIGVELRVKDNQITVVSPLDNSPAQRAGIKSGDILLKANGSELTGLPLDQAVKLMQGREGTAVRLEIKTPGTGATRVLTLIRRKFALHNVSWQRLPGTNIAHLRLSSFSRGTTGDLKKALSALQSEKMDAIILDLRNNPGGLLEEAVGVTSQFLKDSPVVRVKSADGEVKGLSAEAGGLALSIPMAGLINGGTASAAEIVAGALQDKKRARFVGEKSVGTGTVLKQFPLSDGSALLLATYEWLTPAGRVIWHKGITPDVEVSLPPDIQPLFPRAEKDMTAEEMQATKDKQLLAALGLLKGEARSDVSALTASFSK